MYILSQITPIKYPLVAVRITQQQHQRGGVDNVNPSPLYYHCPVKLVVKLNNVHMCQGTVHSSSKATKNESSCPDKIPLQMLPMGIWGPENMKIENI